MSSQLSSMLNQSLSWSLPNRNLNSDSGDEKEMILKQNLHILVPEYIGTTCIRFAFHFLEQIQRADCSVVQTRANDGNSTVFNETHISPPLRAVKA